jgi:hypothetical protein
MDRNTYSLAELPVDPLNLNPFSTSMDSTWKLLVANDPLLSYKSLLIETGIFISFPN